MTPESIPAFLQYGALGLLALWVTWYTREQQRFIRDLMDKLDANAKEERTDWKEFIRSSIEAQLSTVSAMSQIARKLESSGVARRREHDQILEKLT